MKFFITLLLVSLAATCNESPDDRKPMTQAEMDERLIEYNKQMTQNELERIDAFVKENDWPVQKSGTGLQYWIYEDQEGDLAKKGAIATVSFTVTLLDGTACYKTEDGETRDFKIEGSDVESGLHEAIQYMSSGDKAKVILPSHLAHGLAGDMNKIPIKSTIIYDITLHGLR